eukprot:TRINITY_DN8215_c1_g1_i1.p1 TRINITY_DN8215_c1_g1~~TRINITY_DN8215_c1_g1_i1.p1  ORF type:complete len:430 (+),score=79.10 TRINITY_DN8215_c1_g1_i1:30-1319(+)
MLPTPQRRHKKRPITQMLTLLLITGIVGWYLLLKGVDRSSGGDINNNNNNNNNRVTTINEKGKCYYKITGGGVCAEAKKIVIYGAEQDEPKKILPLCTGFPQKKPEGSEATVETTTRQLETNGNPPEKIGYFVMLTLESNLFHVLRDTIANVVDMIEEQGGFPDKARVFFLPKNPAFQRIDHRAYHPLFSGITGGGRNEFENLFTYVGENTEKICVTTAYIGQPFKGYTNGNAGRLSTYKQRVYHSLGVIDETLSNKITIVDRGNTDEDVNRKIGNLDEIMKAALVRGFETQVKRFHKLTLLEQLQATRSSSVLLSSHGQALSWCAFLPLNGICFEIGLWKDTRPDYKLLSKWSGVTSIFIPLPNPDQVTFPLLPSVTEQEKRAIDYYHPYSNYVHRQKQIIYPDIILVTEKLDVAKRLLIEHGGVGFT